MRERSDTVLMILAGIAVIAALIFLPNWAEIQYQVARLAHVAIYGR